MTKRAWFMSLLFPVLSMIGSIIWILMCLSKSLFPGGSCTAVLGLAGGGIVPYVLIARNRIDTSQFFPGKMILFAVSAVIGVLSWTVFIDLMSYVYTLLVLPILTIAAEVAFAARQKTDRKTKVCLTLSSLVWGYLGFVLEILIAYVFY